jgi:hypothetical protein
LVGGPAGEELHGQSSIRRFHEVALYSDVTAAGTEAARGRRRWGRDGARGRRPRECYSARSVPQGGDGLPAAHRMLQWVLRSDDASLCMLAGLERLPQHRCVRARLRQQRGLQSRDLPLRVPAQPAVRRFLLCSRPGMRSAVHGLLHESDVLPDHEQLLSRLLLSGPPEGFRHLQAVRQRPVQVKRGVLPELRLCEGSLRITVLVVNGRGAARRPFPRGRRPAQPR